MPTPIKLLHLLVCLVAFVFALPSPPCAAEPLVVLDSADEALRLDDQACTTHELQLAQLEVLTQKIVGPDPSAQLDIAIDSFYDGDIDLAAKHIEDVLDVLRPNPSPLNVYPELPQRLQDAIIVLARIRFDQARFDEAAELAFELVSLFPGYASSRRDTPPQIVELIEQSRLRLLASGHKLSWAEHSHPECGLLLNGEMRGAADELPIFLTKRAHALTLHCPEQSVGPLLVLPSRAWPQLLLSPKLLLALESLPKLRDPGTFDSRRALANLLQSLLGANRLLMLGGDPQHHLLMMAQGNEFHVAASPRRDGPQFEALLAAARNPQTDSKILLDRGRGFESAASFDSVTAEAIAVSVSAATLLSGVVLYVVASSIEDDILACEHRLCSQSELEQRLQSHANMLLSSQLLMLGGGLALATSAAFLSHALLADSAPTASIACAARGCLATWEWTW